MGNFIRKSPSKKTEINSEELVESTKNLLMSRLNCSVCQKTFASPSTIIPCGHSFCKDCVENQNNCSICQNDKIMECSNRVLHGLINDTEFAYSENRQNDQPVGYILGNIKNILVENEVLECTICNEIFVDATIITCGHTFCKKCIEDWVKLKGNQSNCPICRSEIIMQSTNEVLEGYIKNFINIFFSKEEQKNREKFIKARNEKRAPNNVVNRRIDHHDSIESDQDLMSFFMADPEYANFFPELIEEDNPMAQNEGIQQHNDESNNSDESNGNDSDDSNDSSNWITDDD